MPPKLIAVAAIADYHLLLTYDNGERRTFDMRPYLDKGVFAELKSEAAFGSVHVSFDTVEWSNGADLCPEVLYSQSTLTDSESVAAPASLR